MRSPDAKSPKGTRNLLVPPSVGGRAKNAPSPDRSAVELAVRFREFIQSREYPCVGAKSALGKNQMTAFIGHSLTSGWDDVALIEELIAFARYYRAQHPMFLTFVAFFPDTPELSEEAFEGALWERVASLQAKDEWFGQGYDPAVSPDPSAANFSLSFGGLSFFIVGMHPNASRPARQFDVPVLVFNLHDQFERLREEGRYEQLRSKILERDENLAGSVNPMLARHGTRSEAVQYSGRIVGPSWECPWPGRDDRDEATETAKTSGDFLRDLLA